MVLKKIDLTSCASSQLIDCDVCIVGAGAAGSYLAFKLGQAGKKVVLLEAGDARCVDACSVGFVPEFKNSYYPGAVEGRSFGMGGSTARWGGLLVPHSERDVEHEDADDRTGSWRHIVDVVSANQNAVLHDLGYTRAPNFAGYAQKKLSHRDLVATATAGLSVVSSLFLPIRRKNLSFLLKNIRSDLVEVFCNAVVSGWETIRAGQAVEVRSLTASSRSGRSLKVRAKYYVIAAGTIETTRILQEIEDSSTDVKLSPDLGQNLSDHLSLPIADVAKHDLKRTALGFAPRFAGPWMRSFRFVSTVCDRRQPRSFLHFVFENENPGFKLAKSVFSSIQAKRWPKLSMVDVFAGVGGVLQLGICRYFHSRLYIPASTQARLQLDIEQLPSKQNRITLGSTRDAYNRRTAQIDWRISDSDMEIARGTADALIKRWMSSELPNLEPRDLLNSAEKPHDAYHPVGTCRLGTDKNAVVDLDLKVCGLNNLFAATTGVLPTAGTANPTFSLLCLVQSLCRCILQKL